MSRSLFLFFCGLHMSGAHCTEEEILLQQRGGRYAHTHTHTHTHNPFSMASRYVKASWSLVNAFNQLPKPDKQKRTSFLLVPWLYAESRWERKKRKRNYNAVHCAFKSTRNACIPVGSILVILAINHSPPYLLGGSLEYSSIHHYYYAGWRSLVTLCDLFYRSIMNSIVHVLFLFWHSTVHQEDACMQQEVACMHPLMPASLSSS